MEFSENLSRISKGGIKMIQPGKYPFQRQYYRKSEIENQENTARTARKPFLRGQQA